jgi:hypothetical protein
MTETFAVPVGSDNDLSVHLLNAAVRSPIFLQRYWAKVHKTAHCWIWTGARGCAFGHGAITYAHRPLYAHRVGWVIANGRIPDGLQVNHHCDVPLCVRPDHLYLGTQRDNVHDAVRRGRYPLARKPRRLSDQDVLAIRARAAKGVPQVALADLFGVTPAAVSLIVNGKRRTHLASVHGRA